MDTEPACPYGNLDEEQLVRLWMETLQGLNETGLRRVLDGLLWTLYRCRATGECFDAVVQRELKDPVGREVVHLHRHLSAHWLRREEAAPQPAAGAWRN